MTAVSEGTHAAGVWVPGGRGGAGTAEGPRELAAVTQIGPNLGSRVAVTGAPTVVKIYEIFLGRSQAAFPLTHPHDLDRRPSLPGPHIRTRVPLVAWDSGRG